MLSFGRSSSSRPSSLRSRSSFDAGSPPAQKVDTSSATLEPPAVPAAQLMPSPISESPLKERAATEPAGPSTLAEEVPQSSSPDGMDTATSPVGYVPPPVVDSSIGNPGAFTDQDDEELPQPIVLTDPHNPPKPPSNKGAPSTRAPSIYDGAAPAPVPTARVQADSSTRDIPAQGETLRMPEAEPAPAHEQQSPETQDAPARLPTPSFDNDPTADEAPSHPNPSSGAPVGNGHPIPKEHQADPSPIPRAEHAVPPIPFDITGIHPMPAPSHTPAHVPHQPQSESREPMFHTMPIDDMSSGTEVWATSPRSEPRSNGSIHLDYASIVGESQDNNTKPPPPQITLSTSDSPSMPRAQPAPAKDSHSEREVVMPLPELHEVIPSRSMNQGQFDTDHSHYEVDTDETRPLLATPKGPASYLHPPTTGQNTRTNVNVSPINGTARGTPAPSSWNHRNLSAVPRLHELGWIEYHLPDGTFYYVHPTRRVTTDMNLRMEKVLNAVTMYLENECKETAPSGCELWLRDGRSTGGSSRRRKSFEPERYWVNHQTRSVVVDTDHKGGKKKAPEEDQLDMEYRYWSFIEGHPAHTTLPLNARTEAFEALNWAWTDRLLPSNQVVPAPFSQDECNELDRLLRSFTADQESIQTRLVARILIRVAIWRQAFFRPNKPLPKDVVANTYPAIRRQRSVVRGFFDVLVSIICLGIPYIFFERHSQHRMDEESNLRTVGPMFIIGACTCIVAAIVLSASVTFLALPGLDSIARVAGLVATLFASFSMAATLVAIFRYKSEMVRSAPQIGEGIMWVSKRSLIFSMPMVFLAYAIIGFIAGIILYSVRDAELPNKGFTAQNNVTSADWTTVVGVGALAGSLTMWLLLSRR